MILIVPIVTLNTARKAPRDGGTARAIGQTMYQVRYYVPETDLWVCDQGGYHTADSADRNASAAASMSPGIEWRAYRLLPDGSAVAVGPAYLLPV